MNRIRYDTDVNEASIDLTKHPTYCLFCSVVPVLKGGGGRKMEGNTPFDTIYRKIDTWMCGHFRYDIQQYFLKNAISDACGMISRLILEMESIGRRPCSLFLREVLTFLGPIHKNTKIPKGDEARFTQASGKNLRQCEYCHASRWPQNFLRCRPSTSPTPSSSSSDCFMWPML